MMGREKEKNEYRMGRNVTNRAEMKQEGRKERRKRNVSHPCVCLLSIGPLNLPVIAPQMFVTEK